jgi:hypothetical protein
MSLGNTDGLVKTFVAASGGVAAYKILKFGATAGEVTLASADSDAMFGVSGEVSVAAGDYCDVHLAGIRLVTAGGTIAAGAFVTADSNGDAVASSPTADTNERYVGIALEAAVDNDLFAIMILPGSIQGVPV